MYKSKENIYINILNFVAFIALYFELKLAFFLYFIAFFLFFNRKTQLILLLGFFISIPIAVYDKNLVLAESVARFIYILLPVFILQSFRFYLTKQYLTVLKNDRLNVLVSVSTAIFYVLKIHP